MASSIIGRSACPECGFPHAHVKQKEGEGKRAYRYCPECSSQYYTRSNRQHDLLMAKLVHPPAVDPAKPAAEMVPVADPIATKPADPAPDAPPAPKGYKVILGAKVPL